MKIIGIIPARMAAKRFPNKPMAEILGTPMIGHCYHRSNLCALFDDLYVATCDHIIVDYIQKIGGNAILTSDKHERATERTAEALQNIEKLNENNRYDIIVMIQGDEPLVDPGMLEEVIKPMLEKGAQVSNLMSVLNSEEEINDSNNVKVVLDNFDNALYMSREAIPSKSKYLGQMEVYRQLGLIAFSREALLNFISIPTTRLEIIESVDMNRFLEHRIPIHMELTRYEIDAVDTPEDLKRVEKKMKNNILYNRGYGLNAD
jgi:3-deoxy-manno-octulosonate cytidylyltransferase (CMP-KDO synthetase)